MNTFLCMRAYLCVGVVLLDQRVCTISTLIPPSKIIYFCLPGSHFFSCELLVHMLCPFCTGFYVFFLYRFVASLHIISLFIREICTEHLVYMRNYPRYRVNNGEWKHIWFLKKINKLRSDGLIRVNQTRKVLGRGKSGAKVPKERLLRTKQRYLAVESDTTEQGKWDHSYAKKPRTEVYILISWIAGGWIGKIDIKLNFFFCILGENHQFSRQREGEERSSLLHSQLQKSLGWHLVYS